MFLTTRNLYDQLQAKQVSTGSEGDIVNNLYESSNHLVDEAYSLQSILIANSTRKCNTRSKPQLLSPRRLSAAA